MERKIEKGLFLIEYKTAPYGVWHEVENKQFKTKPKAVAWAKKNFFIKLSIWHRKNLESHLVIWWVI